jgi:hypothetical protein
MPQEEIYRLEKGIESDQKLKHMAELQLSVVSDPASKHQIQVRSYQKLKNMTRLQLSVVSDPASKHQIQGRFNLRS